MTKTQPETTQAKADIYTRVTERILADLAQGVRPWAKPWGGTHSAERLRRPIRHNGLPYAGVNVLLLWSQAQDKGYRSPMWMTYNQAQEFGGQVRKGEAGSLVVYANRFTKTEANDKGEDVEKQIPFMKGYTVFNVDQIDGLPPQYKSADTLPMPLLQLHAAAEAFVAATDATIIHGGDRACYSIEFDFIALPEVAAFRDAESYQATKLHELIHWSGSESRNARQFGKRFGDNAYAFEELVAELGAAFLCADLGISAEIRDDHAAYLSHWLTVLQQDKRAIFAAASHAQRAVDYLHSLQPAARPMAAPSTPASEPANAELAEV